MGGKVSQVRLADQHWLSFWWPKCRSFGAPASFCLEFGIIAQSFHSSGHQNNIVHKGIDFMFEMTKQRSILNNLSDRSYVIDEMNIGTRTSDLRMGVYYSRVGSMSDHTLLYKWPPLWPKHKHSFGLPIIERGWRMGLTGGAGDFQR